MSTHRQGVPVVYQVVTKAASVVALLVLVVGHASAQKSKASKPAPTLPLVQPMCGVGGCPSLHSPVRVTPNGAPDTVTSGVNGWAVTFTVKNLGPNQDSYYLTPSCSQVTCVSIQATEVTLFAGQSTNVWVQFNPGSPNTTGFVTLTAADSDANSGGLQRKFPDDELMPPQFE